MWDLLKAKVILTAIIILWFAGNTNPNESSPSGMQEARLKGRKCKNCYISLAEVRFWETTVSVSEERIPSVSLSEGV